MFMRSRFTQKLAIPANYESHNNFDLTLSNDKLKFINGSNSRPPQQVDQHF